MFELVIHWTEGKEVLKIKTQLELEAWLILLQDEGIGYVVKTLSSSTESQLLRFA